MMASTIRGLSQLTLRSLAIDIHQDRADLCGGELDRGPFGTVRGPDPDAITLGDAAVEQAAGYAIDVGIELGPGVA